MGLWRRRWHSRRLAGRSGARRAKVTALVIAALAVAAALGLAVRFHLDVTALVLLPILIALPGVYLAEALQAHVKVLVRGHRPGRWDPVELGVHQVIDGGPMPAYVCRPHDALLRAVLNPAVPASRMLVVRGGSSTGKTRAAYQAVVDRLPNWRLVYPADSGVLAELLDAGIPARTVLWLGELRHYADADGGPAVLGRLANLLEGKRRLVITTVWPEQWNTYTDAARDGPGAANPVGTVGRLLERLPELTGGATQIKAARGGVIDVPDRFTRADLEAVAATGDPVLREAAAWAASAGQEAQVTQYLAGVPDLLDRYDGRGRDPYGQAVITAAMDATRLGHASPLSTDLLRAAAGNYCTSQQQAEAPDNWFEQAMAYATGKLRGAVAALNPAVAGMVQVVGYRVADYLDQYGRRTRQDQLGPASLWDALTAHTTSTSDLTRLAQAAQGRRRWYATSCTYGLAARQSDQRLRGRAGVDAAEAVATPFRNLGSGTGLPAQSAGPGTTPEAVRGDRSTCCVP